MPKFASLVRITPRSNIQHPTYRALAELGRVRKTIFLRKYLGSKILRREIHQGLNVIESWNSVNDFIFYGKSGEFASNDKETQELTMLALHFIQSSMVYVNTLMIQEALADKNLFNKMEAEDFNALTPLFYAHVNPYTQPNVATNLLKSPKRLKALSLLLVEIG